MPVPADDIIYTKSIEIGRAARLRDFSHSVGLTKDATCFITGNINCFV